MVNIASGLMFFMVVLALLGGICCWFGLVKGQGLLGLVGIVLVALVAYLCGAYVVGGSPFAVKNGEGSQAKFVSGHRYETLVQVVGGQEKKAGEKTNSGLFVIKDGVSDKLLFIRIAQTTLPQYFTVGDEQDIIALPAPALTAPVVSK